MCESQVRGCQFAAYVAVKDHFRLATPRPPTTDGFSVTYTSSSKRTKVCLVAGQYSARVTITKTNPHRNDRGSFVAAGEGWSVKATSLSLTCNKERQKDASLTRLPSP